MRLWRGFGFFGARALTPLLVPATAAIFCSVLTGCATDPAIPTVTKVPVPVNCVKEAPDKPVTKKPVTKSEAEILAMDDYAATFTVWTERLLLKAYAEKAEAIILACK